MDDSSYTHNNDPQPDKEFALFSEFSTIQKSVKSPADKRANPQRETMDGQTRFPGRAVLRVRVVGARFPAMRCLTASVIWLLGAAMAAAEFYPDRLEAMDAAVKRTVSAGGMPGGVLWLERKGTAHSKAYVPEALPVDPMRSPIGMPAVKEVMNGIDVLKRDGFALLRGMKVGLVTNHTGQDRERQATIDLLDKAEGVELVALFSPEHGIRGDLDREGIADGKDAKTGLTVFSLYGERRSPSAEQLAGLDALVFDIQDIGCRFYTYISTMVNCMEAAGKAGVKFVVLDRANPIGGTVEGPVLSEERSFVGIHEIPIRHGMTVGELAMLVNAERAFGADLVVVKCEGGPPLQWFDRTGLPWRDPSPNMRSPTAALLYPAVGMLEFCRISVGRGTGAPFELLGAPYIDDRRLAAGLNAAGLAGVVFVPVRFTPESSVFAKEECGGVRLIVTDRDSLRAAELGLVLASTLHRLHGKDFQAEKMIKLLGDRPTLDGILAGKAAAEIRDAWTKGLLEFERRRKAFLLYPR